MGAGGREVLGDAADLGGDDGETAGEGFQEDVVRCGGGGEVEEGVRGLVGEEEFGVRDAAAIGDAGKAVEGWLFGSGADDVEEDIRAILEGQSGGVEGGEVAPGGANGEQA
jgi:hypothetical protein